MTALLILIALLGTPLFVIIAATALVGFHQGDMDLIAVILEINRLVDTPVLVAIPLFTFAGYIMGEAGTPGRLLGLSRALLGWLPGGTALVVFAVCALFTAFTGASGVTIIAMGSLLLPALEQEGYPSDFALGSVTTSGSLGLLLPPAIPLILYGIIAQTSIDDLFTAGVIPCLIMVVAMGAYGVRVSLKSRIPLQPFRIKNLWQAVRLAAFEIPLPILVLGGIYSGFFAISEAAAITACYALVVEVFVYRDVSFGQLLSIIRKSMMMVGAILVILGVSMASTNYLIDQEVPTKLFELVQQHIQSKWTFLIILNLFLLALGCILDIFSAIVLIVPLILPVATHYGVDPVHLGIVFLANMQIGYSTPPVGMNLFIASYRFSQPILRIYWATLPFLLILIFCVLLITYVPELSLWLTR